MTRPLTFRINGLVLQFHIAPDAPVCFTLGTRPASAKRTTPAWLKWARLVELQAAGHNPDDHHGNKYTGTSPADQLRHAAHRKIKDSVGRTHIEIDQNARIPEGKLHVTTHLQFIPGQPAFRIWNDIRLEKTSPRRAPNAASLFLEYAASLALGGISADAIGQRWAEKMRLHLPDNNWCAECQWRSGPLLQFGLHQFYAPDRKSSPFGVDRISVSSQGTWSTAGALPLAALENIATGETLYWQIEHNGSWHWEISDIAGELYLRASGPTYREGHWSKHLGPGDTFTTAPVVCGIVTHSPDKGSGLQAALRSLTAVRRATRRPHPDNRALSVIFNDYMNCLSGDPTEEKLRPLIARAAATGCEYFVIDAGWYADAGRSWWDTVGEWQPSASRFPCGLPALLQTIRDHGMIPGLWLEIEVMGIHCPLAATLPDDWFFQRDGRRIIDHGRYQLDFRNPAVRAHATAIIDRLVSDYGAGYIKMDYNINAGPGTDHAADSPGDGLLAHNRAYLAWMDSIIDRHPSLVVENCGSGGLRMDAAMLNHHPIQSVTDQTDYRYNAVIAAAAASAVTPEQAAIWSYPLPEGDEEETIFNMVNALLLRIHQSGCIMDLDTRRLARVTEAIALYKNTLRADIPRSLPFWPLGLPCSGDGWLAFGLDCPATRSRPARRYLAVWRLDGKNKTCVLPLPGLEPNGRSRNVTVTAECIYPQRKPTPCVWDARRAVLEVTLARPFTARLFRLEG
ncbi:glycoside hydrolase family 36 protein [Geminisphaera colitermitum]|uniref:glycoside hydrolase family 36 protein n=1 Tax=Geminisphaera colitermitum TaxID=1148786 RepID=UPI000158C884|nr:glycoside hydrolase family 36 protein [Geminisphaera colitermitum]